MLKKSNWKPKYISNSSLIEIYNSQTRIFLKSILKPTKGVKKKKKVLRQRIYINYQFTLF